MLVCTLGDLLLDVVVRLQGPLSPGDDTPAVTHVGPGGQAANVAAWAASLGARSRLIAKLGSDAGAQLASAELERRQVEQVGPVVPGRGGVVVSVSGRGEQRSMLTDRGPARELRADEIDVAWLRGADVFHLSGYALLGGPIVEAGAKAAGAARAQGARISVDLASAAGITAFGPDRVRARLRQLEPDVLFASDGELEALGGKIESGTLVVKHGPGGVTVVIDGQSKEHAPPAVDVVDSTGAGDALAAGFLVGGIEAGLEAAARCLATLRAMP
jgi:sugar/nucleoside kinase (ribokinase family)